MLPLPDLCPEGACVPLAYGPFARDLADRYPGVGVLLHVAVGELIVTMLVAGPFAPQGAATFALPPGVRRVHVRAVPVDA